MSRRRFISNAERYQEHSDNISYLIKRPRSWFNTKMSSHQYRKFHCGDKTILRPSYLHDGISYTGKMTSLYWIRALTLMFLVRRDIYYIRLTRLKCWLVLTLIIPFERQWSSSPSNSHQWLYFSMMTSSWIKLHGRKITLMQRNTTVNHLQQHITDTAEGARWPGVFLEFNLIYDLTYV